MKPDVLMIAVVIFVVGLLASGLGITDVFQAEPTSGVAELQQGVVGAYSHDIQH
jgi:hypothetical protein